MTDLFFEKPVLNSPYEYPARYWELDESGQPTNRIIDRRRRAEFITPIPRPKKRRREQQEIVFDEGKGLSTEEQQYDPTSIINELRQRIDVWRELPNPNQWHVTPETARLLQHWRHHKFSSVRPFFCQVEAVETLIWLAEVAPNLGREGRRFLEHLEAANDQANPGLARLALKLATGLRIFISSVQKEFEQIRADLKAFLLGDAVLRRVVAEVFLFEELPASDRRADQVYLEEVKRCDVYLGIFGYEYGHEDEDGISPPSASTITRRSTERPDSSTCGARTRSGARRR